MEEQIKWSYGNTKLETPVPVRSLKLSNLDQLAISNWMGDHSSVKWMLYIVKNIVKYQEWRNGASNIYS